MLSEQKALFFTLTRPGIVSVHRNQISERKTLKNEGSQGRTPKPRNPETQSSLKKWKTPFNRTKNPIEEDATPIRFLGFRFLSHLGPTRAALQRRRFSSESEHIRTPNWTEKTIGECPFASF